MSEKIEEKRFDNKVILIILFFVFPPLGIYGILKHKTQLWKKVLYILPTGLLFLIITFSILLALFSNNYETGLDYYKKKDYLNAYNNLKLVSKDNMNYKDAIKKIDEIKPILDSLNILKENKELEKKPILKSDEKNNLKEQIEREINSTKKQDYVFAKGNTVEELQMDLVLLGAYWKIIEEGELSGDSETKKLAKILKTKVTVIQTHAFPKLRKKYTEIVRNLLWEQDIDVYSSDGGKVINLTAGIFASNRNIKSTEEIIEENVKMFRFSQIRFRWYKWEDEFTFYKLDSQKDSEPVKF